MYRRFIHVGFEEGSQFINIFQIVRALLTTDENGEDELVLHMSNGHTHQITGDGAMKLIELLSHYTMNYEGKPWILKMDDSSNESAEQNHEKT